MKIDQVYSEIEINQFGLSPRTNMNLDYIVYEKEEKIYFFEEIINGQFRLYSVIGINSFYLN